MTQFEQTKSKICWESLSDVGFKQKHRVFNLAKGPPTFQLLVLHHTVSKISLGASPKQGRWAGICGKWVLSKRQHIILWTLAGPPPTWSPRLLGCYGQHKQWSSAGSLGWCPHIKGSQVCWQAGNLHQSCCCRHGWDGRWPWRAQSQQPLLTLRGDRGINKG